MSFSGFANPTHNSTSPPHPSWSPITPSPSRKRSRSLDLGAGPDRQEPDKRIRRVLDPAPATTLSDAVLSELFVSSDYFEAMYGEISRGNAEVEEAAAQSEFFDFDRYFETSARDVSGHTPVAPVGNIDMLLDQHLSSAELKAWEATHLAGQSAVPSHTFINFQSDVAMEDVSLDMDLAFYPHESNLMLDAQVPNFIFGSQTLPADTLDDFPWEVEAPSSLHFLTPDAQPSGFVFRKVEEHSFPAWWQAFSDWLDASSLNAPSSHRVLRSAPAVAVPLPRGVGEFAASQLFVEDEAME